MTIKVIAADSHPIVTLGIEHALSRHTNVALVGTAHNCDEILNLVSNTPCDVLVTDQHATQAGHREPLMRIIRSRHPGVRIVMHVCIENPTLVSTMSSLGIGAILHKRDAVEHLAPAIYAAHANATYFSPTLLRSRHADPRSDGLAPPLTTREIEVLRLFLSGLSVCEIAAKLYRAKQTVSAHKTKAMAKLGVTSDADLFRLNFQSGLFPHHD